MKFKTIPIVVIVAVAAFATIGCSSGGGGSSPTTASSTLSTLPELEVSLPASLGGAGAPVSGSVRASAEGDVTAVNAADLPYAQASGWQVVYESTRPEIITRIFLEELREFAAEQELAFDTVYTLGTRGTDLGNTALGIPSMDFGRLKLTGSVSDMTVWWYAEPVAGVITGAHQMLHISQSGGALEVEGVRVVEWGTNASNAGKTDGQVDWMYQYYNGSTEEAIFGTQENVPSQDPVLEFARGTRDGGGATTVFVRRGPFVGGTLTTENLTVGWGDDTIGGVAVIGPSENHPDEEVLREVYNSTGALVIDSRARAANDSPFGVDLNEETMFGESYYVEQRIQLRELLPLTNPGETFRRTEGPSTGYPTDDPEITFTDDSFFVDENDNGSLDGGEPEPLVIVTPNYNYDIDTDREVAVTSVEFITSGDVIPAYFSSPDFTAISGMNTTLETLYSDEAPSFGIDVLGDDFGDISVNPQFDDLTN